ncbi:MAG: ankyrin repeat domain-containing protein [Thermoanaerobaculia bacterium]|nr:ankyrin repeat domain-containing protein [Thermoanaerobaculia bacterium]
MPDVDARFRAHVEAGDASALRELLTHQPELREQIDAPVFGFEAPALVFAVGMGHRELAEALLEAGADVDAKSTWEAGPWSALHHAVTEHPDFVAMLLDHGATVDVHSAAGLGKTDRLRELLDENPSLVEAPGPDGQQPLHLAADVATVDFLLQRGADLDALCVDHGSTPAQWAIRSRPNVAQALLQRGARPDVFLAAALGDAELLERLAEEDPKYLEARLGSPGYAPVPPGNILDWKLGWWGEAGGASSPRRIAEKRGHRTFVETWDRLVPPWLQLLGLCESGDLPAVEKLLSQQPSLANSIPPEHHRLLADRAWDGDHVAVQACLAAGLDPHVVGAHESTPLDPASFHGFVEVIRLLLEADPEPPIERQNEFGGTPLAALVYGALHGWRDDGDAPASLDLLLRAGATVSPWALSMATPELAEILHAHGHETPRWARGHREPDRLAESHGGVQLEVSAVTRAEASDDEPERTRVRVQLMASRPAEVEWVGAFVLDEGWWTPLSAQNGAPPEEHLAAGHQLEPGHGAAFGWPVLATPLPTKLCVCGTDDNGTTWAAEAMVHES